MKSLPIFLIISLLLHVLLFFTIKSPSEPTPPAPNYTKVSVVPKTNDVRPTAQEQAPTIPELTQQAVTNATLPHSNANVRIAPTTANIPIIPKKYPKGKPLAPYSFDEMLRERAAEEKDDTGPDLSADRIVKDYLEKNPSDNMTSFNDVSDRYYSYFYKFSASLYNEWHYPLEAAKRGEKGIVRVTFSIAKNGKIADIKIIESSGYSALDREVMRTLKTMNPVPLPASYEEEILHVNGFFIYTQSGDYRLY